MSTSCVLHPRLSNGEKSPLFSRLKNFLGDRKSAEDVYYRAINPSFKEAFPNVRFDHNGEPLLEDLITQCGIGHSKSNEAMLDYLNSEYGTKPVPRTMQSVIELQNRAASFNINSPLNKRYSAEITSSGHDVSMEVVTATGNGRDLGKQQRFNAELNNQLIKLLNSWGADVAALTELEEASNVNGVMDLSAGINAATGLKEVIRISKRHKWSNVSKKENILTDEEQEILNNAPRDSRGQLLAPNGKVSNLTERQYAQVRTKAFKDWFGDWENNPSEASKVVDENGEPLVVYHGSDSYGFDIFDPSKSDDKISLFASSSKWVASTYTSFQPLENAAVKNALLKGNAIDLIKNKDWKSLEKLINSVINYNLPRPTKYGFPLPYGNKKALDKIQAIRKELDNSNLSEEEHLSLLADLTKAEDVYYYYGNYTFKVRQRTIRGKDNIIISIDDSYAKQFNSYYTEEGVIFRGSPEKLIDALTFDTKVYDLFFNIKNPLILDNQYNEYGHVNNWNNLDFAPAAKDVQNRTLWGELVPGTHKQTKTRDVAAYAKEHGYDGVIFKQIADRGSNPGYQSFHCRIWRCRQGSRGHHFKES